MAFGVTSFQNVTNILADSVLFINTENSGNNQLIDSLTTRSVNNCWIPWCHNQQEFVNHHIEIIDLNTFRVLWFIWQQPDQVCASQTGYANPGPPIGGDAGVGKSENLFIGPDIGSIKTTPA